MSAGQGLTVADVGLFLTRISAYWIAAGLALLFLALRRRAGMLNSLVTAAIVWLVLRGVGALMRLLIPCIAPNAESAFGFVVAVTLSLALPLRLWQRIVPLALVTLMAATRSVGLGCQVPGELALGAGAAALAVGLLWFLNRWQVTAPLWRQAMLGLDNRLAPRARLALTPPLLAVLEARLQQHLAFTLERVETIDAVGAHASTPVILSGRDVEGRPCRYFAKIVSQQNWQMSTLYQAVQWVQNQGRRRIAPLWPTLQALVEHEHYMQLLFREAGVPVPRPWGMYRLQRQAFVLVSEYLGEAQSLRGMGEVSAGYVRAAFAALQCMRAADLAHCDIKASNLVVLPGEHLALVDLALAESAVGQRRLARDLADMLLALAMHHDPEEVVAVAQEAMGLRALRQARRYLRMGEVNTETQKMLSRELLAQLRRLIGRRGRR